MFVSTTHGNTLTGNADFDSAIHDAALVGFGGQIWLLGYSDLGLASWRIDPAGSATLTDTSLFATPDPVLAPYGLHRLQISPPLFVPGGQAAPLSQAFSLDAVGALSPAPLAAPGGFPDRPSALATLDGGIVVGASMGSGTLQSWNLSAGSLHPLGAAGIAPDVQGAAIGDLLPIPGGMVPLAAATLPFADRIALVQIRPDGTPVMAESLGASDGIGIDAPGAMAALGDGRHFVTISPTTHSILLLAADTDGSLTARDHFSDNAATLIGNVSAVTSFSVGDRHFVAAGGAEGGLSIFQLLPDETLQLSQSITRPWGALQDLEAVVHQGTVELAAIGTGSAGIARLSLAPQPFGATLTGGPGADHLTGTPDDDILAGGGGNDVLSGGAGADLLLDGTGADTMSGGPGTDTFILTEDGAIDTILDYDPAEDQIDLSRWTFMRSLFQLTFTPTPDGIEITRGAETIRIHSASGASLSCSDFDNDLLGLNRLALPAEDLAPITLSGTAGADWIRGGHGNDTLSGGAGDDVIFAGPGDDIIDGGAGADMIDGGAGHDMLTFASATWRVMVDLQNDRFDLGDAVGDSYAGIEAITAGPYADQLRGDASDNEFYGGRYSDRLYGRAGNDTLDGGRGVDALYGNAGADVLRGGGPAGQRDRFIYFRAADSRPGDGHHDRIVDFVPGVDRVEISRLDADLATPGNQAFTLIGTAPFSGTAGELHYLQDAATNTTLLQADMNGDGLADFEIAFDGILDFTDGDFLL